MAKKEGVVFRPLALSDTEISHFSDLILAFKKCASTNGTTSFFFFFAVLLLLVLDVFD